MSLSAQNIADFIATWEAWGTSVDQLNAWSMGTAAGGPNGDGRYPLTNRAGTVLLIPCPAKIASLVPTGQPMMMSIDCYDDDAIVRVGGRVGWRFVPRAVSIDTAVVSLLQPDQSQPEAGGVLVDVLVGGASILAAPVRVLPGQRMGWSAAAGAVPARSEIVIAVLSEGIGARGLKVDFGGHFA